MIATSASSAACTRRGQPCGRRARTDAGPDQPHGRGGIRLPPARRATSPGGSTRRSTTRTGRNIAPFLGSRDGPAHDRNIALFIWSRGRAGHDRNIALFGDGRRPRGEAGPSGLTGTSPGRACPGFRVAHYSVQDDHAHFLVESAGAPRVANGMKSLAARFARCVNRVFGRKGASSGALPPLC